jgi:hypothetical protein
MVDPWELLDRAMNIENLTEKVIIASYVIYTNRHRLKQIATETAVKFKVMKTAGRGGADEACNRPSPRHKPFGTIQGHSISNSHATGE